MLGLDTYIYSPKADPYLRKQWHTHWPDNEFAQLKTLSSAYRSRSLHFGVGLSPFALYENYNAPQRDLLKRKVDEINKLESPLLAILFDDMPGDMDMLAPRQCEIVADIVNWSTATRILVCPTYYSFDPVLEQYFGKMPHDYLQYMGQQLPPDIDILWTGNKVCSDSVSVADIRKVQGQLGRPVTLWDNYPVNDGAVRSNFLYCSKLAQRESALAGMLGGHLCNPMNQGLISLFALVGLGELYRDSDGEVAPLRDICGAQTYDRLMIDGAVFQQQGLSGMGPSRCRELSAIYAKMPGAAAQEVAGWLRGEYTFDPACLTD